MINWRSVTGLLFLVPLVACANAVNDGFPGGDSAGAPSGGSGAAMGGAPSAGAPSLGGAPSAGAPSLGGAPAGGAPAGGAPAVGGAASAGAAGRTASGGTGSGGQAGTSSGGSSGSAGAGGAASMGPCDNPKDVTAGQSGNLGLGVACLRTKEMFNTVNCSNFDGVAVGTRRTMKVNGMLTPCNGVKTTFAPAIDGWNYFEVSAGKYDYAGFNWYSS